MYVCMYVLCLYVCNVYILVGMRVCNVCMYACV